MRHTLPNVEKICLNENAITSLTGIANMPALSGWRRDVFGADALRLCRGEIGLVLRGETVEAVPL